MTLDTVNFALLLFDLFLEFSKLVLQGLNELLSNFLLFLQSLSAVDSLLAPVFVLLRHAVHIVSHVVDRLAERVGRLAKDLNSLLHELDVVLVKGASLATTGLFNGSGNLLCVIFACGTCRSLGCGRFGRFFLADFAHLNLWLAIIITSTSCGLFVIIISHQLFRLFD